jgi:hypothetical protein
MALDFPSSPTNGQVYNGYTYNSSKLAWALTGNTVTNMTVSDVAPSNPLSGDAWFDSSTASVFIYYDDGTSGQWVQEYSNPAIDTALTNRVTTVENTRPLSQNYIINGDFAINQRGFSSTTNAYGFDRWLVGNSGGTVTYSAQTFTPGAAPVAGYEARDFARVVTTGQSAAGDYAILLQRVEDVRTLAGQTATISFWAKAASGTPKVAIETEQSFGTGGSPSAVVQTYSGQVTLSTSWARYSVTLTVPALTGKTIGTTANTSFVGVNFWVSSGSTYNARNGTLGIQSNTFDFWGVQVEKGSIATPFRRNGPNIQAELAACQRYYITGTMGGGYFIGTGNATGVGAHDYSFVPMRVAPTATVLVFTNSDNTSNSGIGVLGNGAVKGNFRNNNTAFPYYSFTATFKLEAEL